MYAELVAFKEKVLETVSEAIEEAMAEDASRELADTDRVAMEAELKRVRDRLDFWTRRLAELKGG